MLITLLLVLRLPWSPNKPCILLGRTDELPRWVLSVNGIVCLSLLAYMSIKVYLVAKRQKKVICIQTQGHNSNAQIKTNFKNANFAFAKMLAILTLFVYLSYLPPMVLFITSFVTNLSQHLIEQFLYISAESAVLNSLGNALTFIFTYKDIRRAAHDCIRIKLLRKSTGKD